MLWLSKAEVGTPSDSAVAVSRDFAAPRALVYRAFTRPELVSRWLLGPPGWTMPVCEIDLKVGGKYRYRWRNKENGTEFGFVGKFSAIEPEQALHTIEGFEDGPTPAEAKITTSFSDNGDGTRVTYLMDFGSKDARDAAVATGMTDGMELSFKLLDGVLPEMVAGR